MELPGLAVDRVIDDLCVVDILPRGSGRSVRNDAPAEGKPRALCSFPDVAVNVLDGRVVDLALFSTVGQVAHGIAPNSSEPCNAQAMLMYQSAGWPMSLRSAPAKIT